MYKILSDDSLSCPIVVRETRTTMLMCFSREKDLSPEQFVTGRLRNSFNTVSTFGNTIAILSFFMIWYMSWWLISSVIVFCLMYDWKYCTSGTRSLLTSSGYTCVNVSTLSRNNCSDILMSMRKSKASATSW